MQISDLIPIGKIGNHLDEEGYIRFKQNKNHDLDISEIRDVFMLFKDHRVRYVTIDKVLENSRLKLVETEVISEALEAGGAELCLTEEEIDKYIPETTESALIGKKVMFIGQEIGYVNDIFSNSVYNILVVQTLDNEEIMIPDVEYYILDKDPARPEILVRNIQDLLELYSS
ncbi:MAG: hypothetical protein H8E57_04810 [Candidatus Cloacimonetes bacterium]|nr:hypothetical protein [Candidatus Cloacimonadota bacterium]